MKSPLLEGYHPYRAREKERKEKAGGSTQKFDRTCKTAKRKGKFSMNTILENILGKYDLSNPDEKVKCVDEACSIIAGCENLIHQDTIIRELSSKIGIDTGVIRRTVNRNARNFCKQPPITQTLASKIDDFYIILSEIIYRLDVGYQGETQTFFMEKVQNLQKELHLVRILCDSYSIKAGLFRKFPK